MLEGEEEGIFKDLEAWLPFGEMQPNAVDFKSNLSWLILLLGKKPYVAGHVMNAPRSSHLETGETDIGPALACRYFTARLEGGAFSRQLFSAAAFLMQEVRLGGLLVLSGPKNC